MLHRETEIGRRIDSDVLFIKGVRPTSGGHDDIEAGRYRIGKIEAATRQDVYFDSLEDREALQLFTQSIDLVHLAPKLPWVEVVRHGEAPAMIGDRQGLVPRALAA